MLMVARQKDIGSKGDNELEDRQKQSAVEVGDLDQIVIEQKMESNDQ